MPDVDPLAEARAQRDEALSICRRLMDEAAIWQSRAARYLGDRDLALRELETTLDAYWQLHFEHAELRRHLDQAEVAAGILTQRIEEMHDP